MTKRQSSTQSDDGQAKGPVADSRRHIFRAQAVENYVQNQERIELPRLISTRLFRYLWIIALLLMALGVLIVFWPLIQLPR